MSTLATVAERVYVVHDPRLRERRAHLEPVLAGLGWTARWIEAHAPDGTQSAALRPGEASAYLTHRSVLEAIAAHRTSAGFVLEDDALFPDDFSATFPAYLASLPPAWDLVYFGASCSAEVPPDPGHPRYGRERGTRSMSGVLVGRHAAAVLTADLAARPLAAPVDLTLNEIVRARGLVVYWSVPALIANGSETGRFAHSLGVASREHGLVGRLARAIGRWRRR
jgi:GR25 family glycosyltransferase involved in LPS biosynthesis